MSSRSVRIAVVRVVREVKVANGIIRKIVSHEKCSVNRVNGQETVRVDGEDRPLTKYGVRVPYTEITTDLIKAASDANTQA